MTTKVSGECPHCGSKNVRVDSDADSYVGAECLGCGRVFTDADVKAIAENAAKEYVRKGIEDILGKSSLKKR
jgi:uncharacterized Zn finger protein